MAEIIVEPVNDMRHIHKIIGNTPFNAVKTRLSYVDRLFPNLGPKASLILFCINSSGNELIKVHDTSEIKSESLLDVTGCPLEQSYGDDSFNITLPTLKRNWSKDEEKHRPIPRRVASELINIAIQEIDSDPNWTLPFFALCSTTETKLKSILIGSHYDSDWFITYNVNVPGMKSLTDIQNGCPDLLKKHTKKSSINVDISITSSYELFGTSHKMADIKEGTPNVSRGYLKLEGNWNSLSFFPPLTVYTNNLEAEIISGSTASPLHDLWNQLAVLDKYLSMVDDYQKRHLSSRYSVQPLIFPKDFNNPYFQDEDELRRKINRLLIGDDCSADDITEDIIGVNDKEYQLLTFVKELPKRQNIDFTDKFWQIVKGADCYIVMTDCVHELFESITEKNLKPELNTLEDTRFAKMVSALVDEQRISLHAGSISLELVIDMGIEKLTRDYIYLLSNMNVMDMYDLRKMFEDVVSGPFDIQKYRKRLKTLMQIHVSLEFLELIQSQLCCRYNISQSIFETALKSFSGPESVLDFSDLSEPQLYMLSMPAPKEFMTEVRIRAPSSWMCTLSSAKKIEKWSTIIHYSRVPIFPPNIYATEDLDKSQVMNGDMYHTTIAEIKYFKYR